jgi:hypothetical protein
MGCVLLHHLGNASLSVPINSMNTAQLESITNAAMALPILVWLRPGTLKSTAESMTLSPEKLNS